MTANRTLRETTSQYTWYVQLYKISTQARNNYNAFMKKS